MVKLSIRNGKKLLKKLIQEDKRQVPESFISHSTRVSNVAYLAGCGLLYNGIDVDVDLSRVSALLHDVGKRVASSDEVKKDPGFVFDHVYGYRYLKKIGYPEIADIILPGFTSKELYKLRPGMYFPEIKPEQLELKTYEQKLVTYGDMHVTGEGNYVSFNQRIAELRRKRRQDSLLMESLDNGGEERLRKLDHEINEKLVLLID